MRRRRSSARCSASVMRSWTVGRGFGPHRRSFTTSGGGLARGRLTPRRRASGRVRAPVSGRLAVGFGGRRRWRGVGRRLGAEVDAVVGWRRRGSASAVSSGSLRASRSSASKPEVMRRSSRVALPSLRIASGSLSGPRMSNATTAMTSSSVAEMLNTAGVYGAAPPARLRLRRRRSQVRRGRRPRRRPREALEPVVAAQQLVELEQVVVGERRTGSALAELGRSAPRRPRHPGGEEQLDDVRLGRFGDQRRALGAPEVVRALVVVVAQPDPHVSGRHLDVTALGAGGSDRGHGRWRCLPGPRRRRVVSLASSAPPSARP